MSKQNVSLRAEAEVLLAVMIFLSLLYLFSQYVDPQTMTSLVKSWGVYGPLAIIFLQVAFSVLAPLPNSIPVIVAGSIYGTIPGAVYAAIGTILGATICYFIAVKLGRGFVTKMVSRKHLSMVDLFFRQHGFETIIVARLIPVMSFDAVSYGAGLAKMDFPRFIIGTLIGMVPGVLLFSFIGNELSYQWLLILMAAIVIVSALALPLSGEIAEEITVLGGGRKPRRKTGRRRG
ncbi:MAG: TVP38/TMEM64 family protein [Candidatus Micrarchaeota archaeon]